jgi:8-oxo-dGTP pyrophosphatase MutT (NUDIX family)
VKPAVWFDSEHVQAAAGVVLATPDGRLILQLRDDIPSIDNPGMITGFAGQAEPGESSVECALRELEEETGLRAAPEALHFLDAFSKPDRRGIMTANVFYLLTGVDPASLRVTEGRPIILSPAEVAADPRPTPFCKALAVKAADLIRPRG